MVTLRDAPHAGNDIKATIAVLDNKIRAFIFFVYKLKG